MSVDSIFLQGFIKGKYYRNISIYSKFDLLTTILYSVAYVIILLLGRRKRSSISKVADKESFSSNLTSRTWGKKYKLNIPKLVFSIETIIRMSVYLSFIQNRIYRITRASDYLILACLIFNHIVSILTFLNITRDIFLILKTAIKEVPIQMLMYIKFNIGIKAVVKKLDRLKNKYDKK
jgi:hypothetical protein